MAKGAPSGREESHRQLAQNRKARHDYEILETVEAGLSLTGPEVKSIRAGKASLAEAWAEVRGEQVFLVGCHIAPYEQGTYANRDPVRERRLLLHTREIQRLSAKVQERGLTLVPLNLHVKGPWIKLELGVGRGRKSHDKRAAIREKEEKRDVQRELARGQR